MDVKSRFLNVLYMVKRQLRLLHMLKPRRKPEKLTFIYTRLYIRLPVN